MEKYDVIIVGTGPAGMGAAFSLLDLKKDISILMIDKAPVSTGGMRNDCKMNFTYPIGFPFEYWDEATANRYLEKVKAFLKPDILPKSNIGIYQMRAEKLGCSLLEIQQTHLGTDGGLRLIQKLMTELQEKGVTISLREEMLSIYKPLILTEVSKYLRKLGNLADSMADDLEQAGSMGLLSALSSFDSSKSPVLIPYLRRGIDMAIMKELTDNLRTIRQPREVVKRARALKRAMNAKPDAGEEELMALSGLSASEMKSAKWLWAGIGLQLGTGYTVAFLVYQIGSLATTGSLGTAFVPGLIAVAVFAAILVMMIRRSDARFEAEYRLQA